METKRPKTGSLVPLKQKQSSWMVRDGVDWGF
jgi:hypothetical protein